LKGADLAFQLREVEFDEDQVIGPCIDQDRTASVSRRLDLHRTIVWRPTVDTGSPSRLESDAE